MTCEVPRDPRCVRKAAASDRPRTRRWAWIALGVLVLLLIGLTVAGCSMMSMPGKSHAGPLPPLTERQRASSERMRRDLHHLSVEIGERNRGCYDDLQRAAEFLVAALESAGYADVERQGYDVLGRRCENLIVEIPGGDGADEIVVVGAHYDSVVGCPAANDNGTGVVGTLALARALAGVEARRTLRFVLFVNEEPPYFQTEEMGSLVYAKACKARGDDVVAMLSLETIGYYSEEPKSQTYPVAALGLLYPTVGNFILFVGNYDSRRVIRESVGSFRRHAAFPSEGAAFPGWIQGVGWSDHWSFWQQGYPALMVTDTAPFRYPHYHEAGDTIDKVDLDRVARVVDGLEAVVRDLVGAPQRVDDPKE